MNTATRRARRGGRSHEPIGVPHDAASVTDDDWRELANRAGDGFQISLVWSKSADRVKVTVFDDRLRQPFDIHVDGADALSAFHHPFALRGRRRKAGSGGEGAFLFLQQ